MIAGFVGLSQLFFRECDIVGVEVDGDEFAAGEDAFEDLCGVAGEAEGAVDEDLTRTRVEGVEDFVEEDGGV